MPFTKPSADQPLSPPQVETEAVVSMVELGQEPGQSTAPAAQPSTPSSSSDAIHPTVAEYMEKYGMDRATAEEWARFI